MERLGICSPEKGKTISVVLLVHVLHWLSIVIKQWSVLDFVSFEDNIWKIISVKSNTQV